MVNIYVDDKYIYAIDLMFMYVNNNNKFVSCKIKTNKLFKVLNYPSWGKNHAKPNISPMQVIQDKNVSIKQYQQIINSDLRYPIMIDGEINRIIDGFHRLSKAFILKKKYIRAYIFDKNIMEKFIIAKISKKSWNYVNSLTKKDIKKIYNNRF